VNRVLIINDSRFERLFLKDMVAALGFEVHATDEFGSLRQVESLHPEMVIVNYTMTGMTGDNLIISIKNCHPEVKCLLSSCSNLTAEGYPQVDGILQTPVQREALQQLLQQLLASPLAADGEHRDDEVEAVVAPKTERHFQFCPFCGQGLQQVGTRMAFCPYCGQKLA